jgi:hypothetical protein
MANTMLEAWIYDGRLFRAPALDLNRGGREHGAAVEGDEGMAERGKGSAVGEGTGRRRIWVGSPMPQSRSPTTAAAGRGEWWRRRLWRSGLVKAVVGEATGYGGGATTAVVERCATREKVRHERRSRCGLLLAEQGAALPFVDGEETQLQRGWGGGRDGRRRRRQTRVREGLGGCARVTWGREGGGQKWDARGRAAEPRAGEATGAQFFTYQVLFSFSFFLGVLGLCPCVATGDKIQNLDNNLNNTLNKI